MSLKLADAILWILDHEEWCVNHYWVTGSLISNLLRHISSFRSYPATRIAICCSAIGLAIENSKYLCHKPIQMYWSSMYISIHLFHVVPVLISFRQWVTRICKWVCLRNFPVHHYGQNTVWDNVWTNNESPDHWYSTFRDMYPLSGPIQSTGADRKGLVKTRS